MSNDNKIKVPQSFLDKFKHKNIKIETSQFEEIMLQDIYQFDEKTKIKLNRDVTKMFFEELELFTKQKRNKRFNIKAPTRSGKSYVALKLLNREMKELKLNFNEMVTEFICGNQIEYRKKLKDSKFGEMYIVDENFFNRSGIGANIEHQQLTDYNNIIAKKNVGVIFITPEKFLNTGALIGLSVHGRDKENWLTKLLLYHFQNGFPYLIGYIVVDIGEMYRENGCFIYKLIGGCTNHKRLNAVDLDKDYIKYSWCIPQEHKQDLTKFVYSEENPNCPFYDVCQHGVCKYEHKKDSWIESEMSGTLDERTQERFTVAIKLLLEYYGDIDLDTGIIKLQARSGKDLKNKAKLSLHKHSNVKMGIAEFDEMLEMLKSMTNVDFLVNALVTLDNQELTDEVIKTMDYSGHLKVMITKAIIEREKEKEELKSPKDKVKTENEKQEKNSENKEVKK